MKIQKHIPLVIGVLGSSFLVYSRYKFYQLQEELDSYDAIICLAPMSEIVLGIFLVSQLFGVLYAISKIRKRISLKENFIALTLCFLNLIIIFIV